MAGRILKQIASNIKHDKAMCRAYVDPDEFKVKVTVEDKID